jgi:hypothetical protein
MRRERAEDIVGWGVYVHPRGHRLYIGGVRRRERAEGTFVGKIHYSVKSAAQELERLRAEYEWERVS